MTEPPGSAPRVLAVIPARGGSQGVPRKNIRALAGKPLLLWTIEQATAVPELTLTVVSTDDAKIASIAGAAGIRAIDRPAEIATAEAPTEWALVHALDTLIAEGMPPFDLVVVLEPDITAAHAGHHFDLHSHTGIVDSLFFDDGD